MQMFLQIITLGVYHHKLLILQHHYWWQWQSPDDWDHPIKLSDGLETPEIPALVENNQRIALYMEVKSDFSSCGTRIHKDSSSRRLFTSRGRGIGARAEDVRNNAKLNEVSNGCRSMLLPIYATWQRWPLGSTSNSPKKIRWHVIRHN